MVRGPRGARRKAGGEPQAMGSGQGAGKLGTRVESGFRTNRHRVAQEPARDVAVRARRGRAQAPVSALRGEHPRNHDARRPDRRSAARPDRRKGPFRQGTRGRARGRADRGELRQRLAPLGDSDTTACVRAERALSRALSGDCQLPLAAYAVTSGAQIRLRGLVAMPDGSRVVRADLSGPIAAPEELGEMLAAKLRALGADAILASLS